MNVQECALYLKGGGTDTGFCRSEASGLTLQIRERVGPEGRQSLIELGNGPATERTESGQTSSRKTLQFAGE